MTRRFLLAIAAASGLFTLAFAQVGQIPAWPPNAPVASAPATYAHVQGILGPDGTSTTSTTVALAFSSVVTSGNSVYGLVAWDDTSARTLTSVTDDKSNTYNLGLLVDATTDGEFSRTFWLGNITNAPKTITATFSAAIGFRRMLIDEYSGVLAVSNPSDGNTGVRQASATAASSGNITTTISGDLIYGAIYDAAATGTLTAGSGFTIRECATQPVADQVPLCSEDKTQAAAGVIAGTFSLSIAGETATHIIAAKP